MTPARVGWSALLAFRSSSSCSVRIVLYPDRSPPTHDSPGRRSGLVTRRRDFGAEAGLTIGTARPSAVVSFGLLSFRFVLLLLLPANFIWVEGANCRSAAR